MTSRGRSQAEVTMSLTCSKALSKLFLGFRKIEYLQAETACAVTKSDDQLIFGLRSRRLIKHEANNNLNMSMWQQFTTIPDLSTFILFASKQKSIIYRLGLQSISGAALSIFLTNIISVKPMYQVTIVCVVELKRNFQLEWNQSSWAEPHGSAFDVDASLADRLRRPCNKF